ncbi:MAG TPA: TonB-dependent receptor, partial [Luteolibacter sp.]|nr:TonB-dependent receptor [Luteolibacter sp.]
MDNIDRGRVEVDLLKFSGHGYDNFDNRLCALQLVERGLTEATMFLPDGEVVQPAEALYRHPVLLLRGSFDPVTNLHLAMLEQAQSTFREMLSDDERTEAVELCEISMH